MTREVDFSSSNLGLHFSWTILSHLPPPHHHHHHHCLNCILEISNSCWKNNVGFIASVFWGNVIIYTGMNPEFSSPMKKIFYERLSGNTYVNSTPSSGVILSKQENGNSYYLQSGKSFWVSFHPRWPWTLEFVQMLYTGSQYTGEEDNRFLQDER